MATYDNIPLSWNDPLFDTVTESGWVALPNGGMLSNKSITQTGHTASVVGYGSFTLDHVRISSREAVRIGGSGDINISNSWLEATGQPGDHADTIQAYAPGGTGNVTITNTTIVAHGSNATAGMFVADDYSGTFTFNNVVFQGGPYGLRIAADADDIYVSLTDVYFVGPFTYAPFLFQQVAADIHITKWENVHYATIVNGELVPGGLIQPPEPVEGGGGIGAPTIDDYSTDSGTVGDYITNDNTLSLTGTAPANSTVNVFDGTKQLGTVTANASGAWSYTTAALVNGGHSLTATATSGGTTSSPSSPFSITVDTVAPAKPVIASFSTDSGTVALIGTAEANSTVRVYDGTMLLDTVTANSIGAWSYTTGMLSNAIHNFTATATDAAGNVSAASTVLAVTVDSGSPEPTPISGTGGNDVLIGTIGADILIGHAGDDTYTVNSTGDEIVEYANQGTDKVESTISYTLADNVENLQLRGWDEIDGAGNSLNNTIIGNNATNTLQGGAGNDTLNGWGGADTLFGNNGNDVFQFGSQYSADGDKIMDFIHGVDKLDFSKIDASAYRRGDQAFTFDGYDDGGSTRHLWAVEDQAAGVTHLYGRTGDFEFHIEMQGVHLGLSASDFIL
jgi:Ca2+-binding RTX toxin-like protein